MLVLFIPDFIGKSLTLPPLSVLTLVKNAFNQVEEFLYYP